MVIKLGDIFYAKLGPTVGSEQFGVRPVLVVQNNVGNAFSPTIVVIPISSKCNKNNLEFHVPLNSTKRLNKKSVALVEQITTIDKMRLIKKITHISKNDMENVKEAVKHNLNIRYREIF